MMQNIKNICVMVY